MTTEELEELAKALERASEEAIGYENTVMSAVSVVRAYARLEKQFESMADIAERAMAIARLYRQ